MEDSKPKSARIAAIYARVSTDSQRAQGTVQSQVSELRELAAARGLAVGSELVFCDEGVSGATLVRPALERLRDGAVEGSFEVVLCHSPDRLARRYAYQVLVLDELARAGVEVIFAFEDERSQTPEGELLRQMQGMIAEYERAQIAERTRRGRLHRGPRQPVYRGAVSGIRGGGRLQRGWHSGHCRGANLKQQRHHAAGERLRRIYTGPNQPVCRGRQSHLHRGGGFQRRWHRRPRHRKLELERQQRNGAAGLRGRPYGADHRLRDSGQRDLWGGAVCD